MKTLPEKLAKFWAKRLLATVEARDREIAEAEKAYDGVCQSLTTAITKRDSVEALTVRLVEVLMKLAAEYDQRVKTSHIGMSRLEISELLNQLLSSPEVLAVMEKRK